MTNELVRRALLYGAFGGAAGIHVSLVGLVGALQSVPAIGELLSLGTLLPFMAAILVGWASGSPSAKRQLFPTSGQSLALGALAGAVTGALVALLAIVIQNVDLSWILVNARPQLAETLQFGQGPVVGSLILIGGAALAGLGWRLAPGAARSARAGHRDRPDRHADRQHDGAVPRADPREPRPRIPSRTSCTRAAG